MIDRYEFGEIMVNGWTYGSDLLIFPERVNENWWRVKGHELVLADLREVLADPPEVLIVGTGRYGRMAVPAETQQALTDQGIELVIENTKAACQTYNEMALAGRRVVAALHLTC